jgi:hypothetical protein
MRVAALASTGRQPTSSGQVVPIALTLKVGSIDLSESIRVAHDQGMDPANPTFTEPQFTGPPALGEGQGFAADTVNNREMAFPLILSAEDTDALYELVREINAELVKGKQVEFRSSGASQSTFFDLERGRLEEQYEHWLDQGAHVRAMLHLWVRPFGHTGTFREVIPSIAATGPQTLLATGILGDEVAQVRMRVDTTPSYLASAAANQVIAYGISQSASYVGVKNGKSLSPFGTETGVIGASGAVGSQYRGFVASPRGEQTVGVLPFGAETENDIRPYEGRQRLLMVARTRVALASGAPAITLKSTALGLDQQLLASIVATHSANWQLYDCGEWAVSPATGLEHGQQLLEVGWTSANPSTAASLIAVPALQVNALIMVPLDVAAGIHLGDGWDVEAEDPHLIFEPNSVTRKTATGVFFRDETAKLRGINPELPPTGSPVASGPLTMVVVAGDRTDFVGNKPIGVELAAREAFRYLQ